MVRIRVFEERVQELFLARKLPGFVHVYIGEEAVAAGVCAALRPSDYITSTHRGHGHAIAKGVELNRLMAELYGKATGVCRGRGGSMHVADFGLGMLGANGIVAAGCGIAAGSALSAVYRGSGQVTACFFGDGGVNKGSFHEALNFAAVHSLPVVYVCENNQYSQYTAIGRTTSVDDIARRADGYGMPGLTVDGNDALAVRESASEAVERARAGGGPTLLHLKTYRLGGHFVGDAEEYRARDEVAEWRSRDPIVRLETLLAAQGILDEARRDTVWHELANEVAEAERFAEESAYPDEAEALEGVFT
jgi:pyruvate dehydrogenase E1 component alpha subunit